MVSYSSNSMNEKKVMLLSRHNDNNLLQLIEVIRQAGCKVVLLATALGYNQLLKDKNYDDLADQIRTVYTSVLDPPPTVTITGISQLVPFLEAVDPDLIISCCFPYQLTGRFLEHRSVKINGHPTPLPLYRGINCFARAILEQVRSWGITWHYITESYDAGNILVQEFFELQTPYGIHDIGIRTCDLLFVTLGKAIQMALERHPGTPQRQPTCDEKQYVDPEPISIAERTIRSGLSCHEVWCLVEACKCYMPALLTIDERLYQVIEARCLKTSFPITVEVGEIKRTLHRFVQQCTDGQMEYTVRLV